ncbi:heme ABC exporter ATP-binding protein CcmA [Natronospora cellulosivora (SeqCode)]
MEAVKSTLVVENLKKRLAGKEVLKGISLNLQEGEILSIFGPNGAGKTTLLNLLSTLSTPAKGKIILMGEDIRKTSAKIKRKVGLVSHKTFLYDSLTAYENLEFYAQMYSLSNYEDRILTVIREVGLDYCLYDLVDSFSRGMKQRLAIARAIIHYPELLLLDEPYTGLDQHAIVILNKIIKDLNKKGRSTVIVTHNLEQGFKISDKFIILLNGSIKYSARTSNYTLKELYDRYSELIGENE